MFGVFIRLYFRKQLENGITIEYDIPLYLQFYFDDYIGNQNG